MAVLKTIIAWWVFPIIAALVWLGMLLGLFLNWYTNGKPHLPSMGATQRIAYLSDTGAYGLQPLFIACGVISVVFLDIALIAERWLRHTGRLAKNTSRAQKAFSGMAIIFALGGAAGFMLLTICDTYDYPKTHDIGLGIFIIGYIISAIFLCIEYQRLGIHYKNHKILALSFWVKLFFIFTEAGLAIAFVVESYRKYYNVAAVLEWTTCLVFTFWIMSFIIDLLPSVRTRSHIPQGHKEMILAEQGTSSYAAQGANGGRFSQSSTTYERNLTNDSAGPNQPYDKYALPPGAPAPRGGRLSKLVSNLH